MSNHKLFKTLNSFTPAFIAKPLAKYPWLLITIILSILLMVFLLIKVAIIAAYAFIALLVVGILWGGWNKIKKLSSRKNNPTA
ncbi:hypothetical protein ACFOEE_06575 [Pseudoalteromonas fenneropenaei]|uniref:Uncharacterized protein n=1 Tax=Pseudoalteromonas fenneropenaei TaxID=1737459 RepID=A0ABV7CHV8_9GAMM